MNNYKGKVMAIGSLTFIMIFGNSMFVPVLPDMQIQWDLSSSKAGLILTAFSLAAAAVIPLTGYVARFFGKKGLAFAALMFVSFGCVLAVLSSLEFFSSAAFTVLLAGRVCQGIGAGFIAPLPFMFTGDIFSKELRPGVLGLIEVFNGLAKAASPFAAILAVQLGGNWLFFIYLSLAALSAFLITLNIRGQKRIKKSLPLREFNGLANRKIFTAFKKVFPYLILGGVTMCLLFGMLTFFSYKLEWIYGIDGIVKAVLFSLPLIAMTAASWLTGKYLKGRIFSSSLLLNVSAVLSVSVLTGGLFHQSLTALVTIMILFSIASGIFLVCCNLLITENVLKKDRDVILSFYSMIRFTGVAAGPPLFAIWMYEEGLMFAFSILTVAGVRVILVKNELKKNTLWQAEPGR
ncbi:MFS transporter [Salipaludibacillus aurantiacus]|uniref:MFS transporter, ACDE family, multidrug resistance protein n=1 Tax=Salipaludibacillus aurantiacus TaxID=1601833 RepID=A0A1H9R901_9BACI|nr:MFS transporter [Salipaludibacillus aurantiacus]SER69224.1 MFS transporter, ACDE family, multidrug resistance protein [Salipaludibacillus aurantiacus]